jgi:hypothetical protein
MITTPWYGGDDRLCDADKDRLNGVARLIAEKNILENSLARCWATG